MSLEGYRAFLTTTRQDLEGVGESLRQVMSCVEDIQELDGTVVLLEDVMLLVNIMRTAIEAREDWYDNTKKRRTEREVTCTTACERVVRHTDQPDVE